MVPLLCQICFSGVVVAAPKAREKGVGLLDVLAAAIGSCTSASAIAFARPARRRRPRCGGAEAAVVLGMMCLSAPVQLYEISNSLLFME